MKAGRFRWHGSLGTCGPRAAAWLGDATEQPAVPRPCRERAGSVPCRPSSAELRPRRAWVALGQAGAGRGETRGL